MTNKEIAQAIAKEYTMAPSLAIKIEAELDNKDKTLETMKLELKACYDELGMSNDYEW